MKRFAKYILMGGVLFAATLVSCNDDDEVGGSAPTIDLAALDFKADPGKGYITLSWNLPDPGECDYIRLEWYDPREKKTKYQNFSNYPDAVEAGQEVSERRKVVIENTRARYGDAYNFKFTAYRGNTPGSSIEITKITSGAAPIIEGNTRTKLDLKVANFATNSTLFNGKKLDYICDGIHDGEGSNKGYLFHTNNDGSKPYYVDIDFGEELSRFEIYTWNSFNHADTSKGIPKHADIYVIKELNDETVDVTTATALFGYDYAKTSAGEENSYTYPELDKPELATPVRYIRYYPISDAKGNSGEYTYWNLSELEIYKVVYEVSNPEVDEVPIYDEKEEAK